MERTATLYEVTHYRILSVISMASAAAMPIACMIFCTLSRQDRQPEGMLEAAVPS